LAILAVFLNHAINAKLLWMGVDLFFVLSGFLITGVLLNAKDYSLRGYFAKFYARRARRILPPYLLTLLAVSIVFGVAWSRHWYFYILFTNLLDPLHIPHPLAFSPLWSLAVEEQFYLVWPFAVYFLSERRLAKLAACLIVVAPMLRGFVHFRDYQPVYTLTPFRMDLLAVGALLCLAYRHMPAQIERVGPKLGFLFGFSGVAGLLILEHNGISTGMNTRTGNVWIYECTLFVSLGVMLWALSGRYVGALQWRPLTYIGKISYTMYLVHRGVLELCTTHLDKRAAAIAGLAITIGYASISWYLMERNLLVHDRKVKTFASATA
jgi:peptidoglycan/LPS O-acetylase OafA/YrhL